MSKYFLILIPNSSLLEKQTPAQSKVANPTPPFLFLLYNTRTFVWNEVQIIIIIMIIIIIVITIKIRPTFMHVLFLFPWGVCIFLGIKEGLSNYDKAFIISWDLLKSFSIKLKERHGNHKNRFKWLNQRHWLFQSSLFTDFAMTHLKF